MVGFNSCVKFFKMNLKTLPVFHADVYEKKKEVTPMHLELGIFRPTPQCT